MKENIIIENIKCVTTINNTLEANNIVERILWLSLTLSGTFWMIWVVHLAFKEYTENPSFTVKTSSDLSEVDHPAITYCTEGSTKNAIAERIGNYLNANETLPKSLAALRSTLLKCVLREGQTISSLESQYRYFDGTPSTVKFCQQESNFDPFNKACEVS